MLEDITDFFRNGLPYFLVLYLVCGPTLADSNFAIQRMVQYEVAGISYGSKASALNMEAKAFTSNYNFRTCILTRFQDMNIDQFRDITGKAGGLIILLPKNLSMSNEDKESLFMLEQVMLAEEIAIPVYFAKYDEEIEDIILEISRNPAGAKRKDSALIEMFNKISANGYQIVVTGASHAPKKDSKIPVIQGELIPFKQVAKTEDGQPAKLPVIVITTQLKTFGITNIQPPNHDTTVMLTLIEMFSKLYNQMSSSAKYRVVFVLHESGSLLNFQGAKKFLDNNLEESSIQSAEFALCLDSFAENLDEIMMHVSKPLKDGPAAKFYEILAKKAELYGAKPIDVVHKKINLADTFHKWAHERFSMRRISAFTLSSLKTYSDPQRTSIFTEYSPASPILESGEGQLDQTILENIQTNTKILAEALATYIFFDENESGEIFIEPLALSVKTIQPYVAIKSISKSQNIKMTFEKFLKNVKLYHDKPDAREPDFMFYEGGDAVLNVYNVKPAVFDLFLTSLIACYLFAVYFVVIQFPKVYDIISKLSSRPPSATTNGVGHHKVK